MLKSPSLLTLIKRVLATILFSAFCFYANATAKWVVVELKNGLVNTYLVNHSVRISIVDDDIIVRTEEMEFCYPKARVKRYYVAEEQEISNPVEEIAASGVSFKCIGPDEYEVSGLPEAEPVSVYSANGLLQMRLQAMPHTTINISTLTPGVYIIYSASLGSVKVLKK